MTSNKKQTAVEWLEDQIFKGDWLIDRNLFEAIEQAKEMDMEQKQNMFDCGRQYQLTGEGMFKEVYEEIYGDK
jgi:hypothetical protein